MLAAQSVEFLSLSLLSYEHVKRSSEKPDFVRACLYEC